MRVCHIVYASYPADPRVRREVDALREASYNVSVIALRAAGQSAHERVDGVTVHRVPLEARRGGRIRYLFQYLLFFLLSTTLLLSLHVKYRFRVVHVHSLPDFQVFSALPLRLLGVSVILDLHEAFPEIVSARFRLQPNSPLVRIAHISETLSIAVADQVITVNDTIRDLLVRRQTRSIRIEVVTNSPDNRVLRMGDRDGLRERLHLTQPAIVYVGGINPERDLATLIRAVHVLKDRILFQLVIAGYSDAMHLASLKTLTTHLGLDGAVSFLNTVPHEEVLTYLALSRVGVISYEDSPLTQIAIPTKAFEYAAAGIPMAMADLRALRGMFDGAAEFFRPGDPNDLATAIERIVVDGARASAYVQRAQIVLAENSWEKMRLRLLAVYRRLGGESS